MPKIYTKIKIEVTKQQKKANFWSDNLKFSIFFFPIFDSKFSAKLGSKNHRSWIFGQKKSMILTFASLGLASEAFHAHLLINDISTNIFQRSARFLKKNWPRIAPRKADKKGGKVVMKVPRDSQGRITCGHSFFLLRRR